MDDLTRTRHDANRVAFLDARATAELQWKAEDLATEARRKAETEAWDRGLAAHDAMVANDGVPPAPKEEVSPEVQAERDRIDSEAKARAEAAKAPEAPKESFVQRMEEDLGLRAKPAEPVPPAPEAPPPTPPVAPAA